MDLKAMREFQSQHDEEKENKRKIAELGKMFEADTEFNLNPFNLTIQTENDRKEREMLDNLATSIGVPKNTHVWRSGGWDSGVYTKDGKEHYGDTKPKNFESMRNANESEFMDQLGRDRDTGVSWYMERMNIPMKYYKDVQEVMGKARLKAIKRFKPAE